MFGFLTVADSSLLDLLTLGGFLEETWEFWLWSSLLLLIVEIFTSGFFLGALAICTLLTAGGAALDFSPAWQVVFFSASSIGSLLWVRPVFVNLLSPQEVATNTAALVGQRGTVVAQVPADGHGRVRLANEEWRATSAHELQVGAAVTVAQVTGNTITVEPS